MRSRTLTTLAIGVAALAAFGVPTQAVAAPVPEQAAPAVQPLDVWHFVAHYGHNFSGCDAKGKSDVRNGWAGAYDCRNVGPVLWPNFDLWEA